MEAEPLLAMPDVIDPLAYFASASQRSQSTDVDGGREADQSSVHLTADVEAFLARLRREQVRFLDAISAARLELYRDPGQLAKAAALQARLTQRFLDAQRSILRGRAEADAKVARIVGDLGTDNVASVVSAPFEPDFAQAERQLQSLLDDWWRAEAEQGKAGIDDACAGAAIRLDLSRIDGAEVMKPVTPNAPVVLLPAPLLAALDTVDHSGLDALLASLLDALGSPSADHRLAGPAADEATREDPVENSTTHWITESVEEAFDSFWGAGSTPWARRVVRNRVVVHVLFPTVTVVAGLALVLAWTG